MKIVSALIILLALLMEKAAISKYVALFTLAVFCSSGSIYCIKYNTGAGIVNDKLNVHLVAHSHDDVGWLKTVDQYFVGSNNSIQGACVENVLDSVVEALQRYPTRKFVFAEQAFFQRWWAIQDMETQAEVRKLVDAGQLEFVNGGWVMHDEAASHYIDMIDQTTLGHRFIKEQFNKTPRAGWQIDPFGHSAVQAYLLGAELGFNSVHFARIDYQDRLARKGHKSLETIWRGSKTFGCSSQIFSNVFPVHYSAPGPFHFEVNDERSIPVQDNPLRYDYNVAERVNDFVHASIIQANVTRANHIMWTMGDDFQYQYAESWFKQMDKLIHYVNKDGRVNALYSTPSIYTDAKNVADETWPLKVDDYFPYADGENAYWTGYFTSRPAFKRYVRTLSGYYLAARQLEYLSGRRIAGPNTFSLGDALGVAQHHDAITGTAKQHTTNDYIKRLAAGASEAEAVTSSALACLLEGKPITQCNASTITFDQCQLLNISYCPSTEQEIPKGKSLVMVAYNPLGWNRTDVIRIPVDNANLIVQDSSGSVVEAQYLDMDNVTVNLRNFYTKAYLGILPEKVPKFWLCFGVSVPPLGWNTYFISERNGKGIKRSNVSVMDKVHNQIVEIGPGNLKMSYSASGQYHKMFNSESGVDLPLQQSFLQYESSIGEGDGQASGAYIFRPSGDPSIINRTGSMVVVRGGLVDEIHQQFDSWIYQVTRLYRDKEHAEVEFTIGPIPVMDSGKEVITKMKTNMATNTEFYTDSNGRDFMKRIRNYRKDWILSVHQPVAGNYYPINLGIYVNDSTYELSVLVDRATGGASIKDGEIELMLHRRLLADDGKGVEEALDEQVCVEGKCDGLTIRGRYYMSIHKLGGGAQWRRTTGQEVYSPLLLAFTHENSEKWKASRSTKATFMDSNYSFPLNVALITLQELEDKSVLLRLAHLYEAGEDAEYSRMAIVELKKMFSGKEIKEWKEMSLSANQEKSEMKRLKWRAEGENSNNVGENIPIRGSPVNGSTLVVELGPMEIRTFLLNF
ncbi:alpha-mannosidase isoform X2 [Beta vulgaris subsp. vulgaris]|uniref:alpha-mannosidase isoform X2 n=1 Tax=Beta vulgaris subsp. vulgaris TaxID=3555 RepID=UPI0025494764|nr:alpha-mannosidase isoform X2 [Beta vulgaris subsp. vulgaris]